MFRIVIRSYISTHPKIARKIEAFFVRLHNYSYHKVSEMAGYLNKGIHPKHFITNYHQFFLDNISANDRVVDLGSGSGFLSFDLAKKAKSVFGLELSKTNVDNAKRDYTKENLTFKVGDITTYKFEDKFDKAVLSNVLEHIKDRIGLLKLVRNFAPVLLVRVPMISRDWISVYKKQNGYEYRLDETHFIEYTLPDFFKEAESGGWSVESYSVNWGEIWAVLHKK